MKAGRVQSRLSRRRLLTLGAFTAPLLAQQSSISRASKGTSSLRITKVEAMVIRTPKDELPPEALVEMPPIGSLTGGLGLPVWQLLGGKYRDRIPTYTGIGGRSPEELKDNAVKAVESGFGAVKMGLSKGPGTNDLQRVSVIADAIKGKGQLLVDSLEAYKL